MRIYKYGFDGNRVSVDLPISAYPLSFWWQGPDKGFQIWIALNADDPIRVARHFRYFVTGEEDVRDIKGFIGTAHAFDGKFVAHCFETNTPW